MVQMSISPSFLESAPLYSKIELISSQLKFIKLFNPIQLDCPRCKMQRTFSYLSSDETAWMKKPVNPFSSGKQWDGESVKVNYSCSACQKFTAVFMLVFNDTTEKKVSVKKVGQYPVANIDSTKETKRRLAEFYEIFEKGRKCELHSFGIGAFGYYRRIVELKIKDLMVEVSQLILEEDRAAFATALQEIESSHYAKDKIDLVSDFIPLSLKPGGHNPIGVLYAVLSEGIHSGTDEECLEVAVDIRKSLENLIHLLSTVKIAAQELSESTKKLLNRRNK